MFMLEFLKKVFGNKAEINTSVPSSYTNVQVPNQYWTDFFLTVQSFIILNLETTTRLSS